ncbi:phage head-tail joining protein [Comamonas aquatica]|uniref:phage head-tail joining protein n=1 Tax=Comamonas aquatica TaxID=225991 RepID=UPI00244B8758|nr:hypothetical protein [Comamonas aquatica]MDH0371815.1 hypothetical protein [Comamonas aquatica]MDH1815375.1 hypothetical protein [Comamonas aquatica]
MSTPTDLHATLARINAAIHSGERRITTEDGASVEYRSLQEMLDVRRDLQAQIAAQSTRAVPRLTVARPRFTTLRGG